MPFSFKLLMVLSTPFPLRPSAAIQLGRHSRLPLDALSSIAASRSRLLSAVLSSKFGFSIRAAGQVHTQAVAKEGCSETLTSHAGFKDSHSWPEWSKLADHLLAKGYSQREVTLGDQDDSMLMYNDLPDEFLRAAETCLDFARERPDILRLLTKKYMKAVVENGSPFLFKNGGKSVNRMRLFLSGDAITELEPKKAQTIDIMRYLLSYIYKPYSSSNGNKFKDYEFVETSVRRLLLELFNFSGTAWRSKLTEPTKRELPLGNGQLSRPPRQSLEMKRGDWIFQKKWMEAAMLGASCCHSNYATTAADTPARYSLNDLISHGQAQKAHKSKPDYPAVDEIPQDNKGSVHVQSVGKRISAEDKKRLLVNTLVELKDSKEVVYGTLDAWVAWEQNFPLALLKRALLVLEKEEQWHRIVQVIKWMLSKGQGTTMGTYEQLICALEKDNRPEEAHTIWVKKISYDLHSVPWRFCDLMLSIYYRNDMLDRLVKLFEDIESYGRKPPSKSIVRKVVDAYELLGLLEEKNRVLQKYDELFNSFSRESPRKLRKFLKRGIAAGKKKLTSKATIDKPIIECTPVDSVSGAQA